MKNHVLVLCGCGRRTVYARGLCNLCYQKWWKANTTTPVPHGTLTGYQLRGCRCDACSKARARYRSDYFKRTGK